MTTEYIVRIRNRAGIRQWDITDFLGLNYSKFLNGWGVANVQLPNNHDAITSLEKDGQIEIWRFDESADPPIAPYCDFFGLYRGRDRATPSGGSIHGVFTAKLVEQKHYLFRAVTGHPAGTTNRNDFDTIPTETIMKNLVKYNCTPSATLLDGRKRVPTWVNLISVAADTAQGATITKSFAHRKIDECLQELAAVGGLDWDLVKTGLRTWEFRTGTWGSDLSDTVRFSLTWDNLDNPQLTSSDINEETVAMVWGQDSGVARSFLEVHGPNYAADYNDIEVYIDAANQTDESLQASGDARMNEVRARDDFTAQVFQNGPFVYGRDYCTSGILGDIVGVTYYESSVAKRIRGAQVSVVTSSGGQKAETIQLDMVTAL